MYDKARIYRKRRESNSAVVYIHIHVYTYTHTCICIYTHIYIHTNTYRIESGTEPLWSMYERAMIYRKPRESNVAVVYIHIHVYIHTHTHVYVYIHKYMYIYTYRIESGTEPLWSMYERAMIYRKRRESNGAVVLQFPEAEVSVDDKSEITIEEIPLLSSNELVRNLCVCVYIYIYIYTYI
jgi:hypothetical protein